MEEAPTFPIVYMVCELCRKELKVGMLSDWVSYCLPDESDKHYVAHTSCYIDKFYPKNGAWLAPAGKKEEAHG